MKNFRIATGLALLGLVGNAMAQTSDLLPPPPASVCPAPTVSTEPGNVHAFPGRWWNPQRNGIGWDFFYGEGQRDMYLTWFTYDDQGRPVWLHGEAQPLQFNAVTGERTWQSRLYVANWTFSTSGRTFTRVGSVSVTYPNQTTTRAAVRWQWDKPSSVAKVGDLVYDECLFDTFRDQRSQAGRTVINQAFSSNWFYRGVPDDPLVGWGVDLLVDRVPTTSAYVETATAAIFDVNGRPVWMQAVDKEWGSLPPANDTLTATDKGELRYFRFQPVAGAHPAVTVCDDAVCGPKAVGANANSDGTIYGRFGRLIQEAAQGRMSLTAQVPDTVTGIGAVSWPPPDTVQDPNLPVEVPVMRFDANHVVVDKSVCRVVNDNDLCTFTVSWSSNDPNASIRRIDLNTQGSQQIAGGLSSIYPDQLPLGARVQYEITYRYNGNGPQTTLRTPEVRVLKNGIADATVQNIACVPQGNNGCDLATHEPGSGLVPGEASTEGGAAVYSIPIRLPPGRNGMQPELALGYNSRSGNGIAGLGWSLSGFSAIHRCPRTAAQDASGAAVSLSMNDALCLDGERLVLSDEYGTPLKEGDYGVAGAYYRTEINDFSRVTQLGGDLAAAASCFKVEHKSGDVSYYGGVPAANGSCAGGASRVVPHGVALPMSWQIERREDASGNSIDYSYAAFGKGEKLPTSIAYTGKGSDIGNRVVGFNYKMRPAADQARSYLAGGLTERTRLLESIDIKIAGDWVSRYELVYTDPISATDGNLHNGRSALQRIRQCGYGRDELADDGNDANDNVSDNGGTRYCLPDTVVHWSDLPPDHVLRPLTVAGLPNPAALSNGNFHDRRMRPIGDLDGDGVREAVVTQYEPTTERNKRKTWLVKLTADRTVQGLLDITDMAGAGTAVVDTSAEADFDGDGRSDLLVFGQSGPLKLVRWNLGRGANFGTTSASTFASADLANVPGNLSVVSSADLNRDGRADLLLQARGTNCQNPGDGIRPGGGYDHMLCFYPNLTTASPSATFGAGVKVFEWTHATPAGNLSSPGDLNGDGIADFVVQDEPVPGSRSAPLITRVVLSSMPGLTLPGGCTAVLTGQWQSCTPQAMNLPVDTSGYRAFDAAMRWHDVNGDGMSDLLYALPGTCDGNGHYCSRGRWDVQIANGKGFDTAVGIVGNTDALLMTTGWEFNRLRYAAQLPTADVDSDGKADLLYPVALAARQCMAVMTTYQGHSGDDNCGEYDWSSRARPDQMAICSNRVWMCGNDPSAEISGTGSIYSLPQEQTMPTATPQPAITIDNMYSVRTHKAQFSMPDQSMYYMAGLRFVPVVANNVQTYEAQAFSLDASAGSGRAAHRVAMTLDSSNGPNVVDDLYGDGLADLFTSAGCVTHGVSGANCHFVGNGNDGPATYATAVAVGSPPLQSNVSDLNNGLRSFVNENVGVAENLQGAPTLPDLVRAITKGQNDTTSWIYYPLSSKAGRLSNQLPLYTLPENGYVDGNHFYFLSTMPVVGSMTSPPGNGGALGFRSWRYGYSEAMYNRLGRGFQGFRGIFREQILFSGDALRGIREITLFHQKFPLSSRLEATRSGAPVVSTAEFSDPLNWVKPFVAVDYVWGCQLDARTTCSTAGKPIAREFDYPFLTQQTTTTYDPLRAELGYKERVATASVHHFEHGSSAVSGWDAYGNPVDSYTEERDYAESSGALEFVTSKQVRSKATYANDIDTNRWWPGRLETTAVTTMPVTYGAAHPLPTGLTLPELTLDTQYFWNDGNRTPDRVVVEPGTAQQSTTQYVYPQGARNFGLPEQVTQTYDNGGGTSTNETRTVQTLYAVNGDGYFPSETVDAADIRTQLSYRARDGQIRESTLPTNVYLRNYYDAFGRTIRSKTYKIDGASRKLLTQPVHIAWNSCTSGVCAGVGQGGSRLGNPSALAEAMAAYRVTTVQNGSPTRVTWYDMLGREIKSAQRGYDGTFVALLSDYDNLGLLAKKSVPFFLAGSPMAAPFVATTAYDRAGRVTSKTSPGGDTAVGVALDANKSVTTGYRYFGNLTQVFVRGNASCPEPGTVGTGTPANVCVEVARHSGVLGLMRTKDAMNGVTRYWADAAGRPVAIADANANAAYPGAVPAARVTRANYDVLGHRTGTQDPNQGSWSFFYNGLGELSRQKDAREITTTIRRDNAGRPQEQTVVLPAVPASNLPNVSPVAAAAAEYYRDEWSYESGTGLLSEVRRCITGSLVTSCSTGQQGNAAWSESYTYDAGRLATSLTWQALRSQRVSHSAVFHHDANFGREKAVQYGDNGLKVQRIYTKFGALRDVIDADTGERFWGVGSADAYGNVTRQDYGNGMVGEFSYDPILGRPLSRQWRSSASPQSLVTERVAYGYDALSNLKMQERSVGGLTPTETYDYDGLQRLTAVTTPVAGASVAYRYDALGNLLNKSDFSRNEMGVAAYHYVPTLDNKCGPNVATRVDVRAELDYDHAAYFCDANGNATLMQRRAANQDALGGARSVRYDASNRPRTISDPASPGAPTAEFVYAPDGRRVYEILQERYPTSETTTASRLREVLQGQRGYQVEIGADALPSAGKVHRHELGEVSVVLTETSGGKSRKLSYKALDRLGSPLGLMDERGEFLQVNENGQANGGGPGKRPTRLSLGAFGEAREANFAPRLPANDMAGRINLTAATRQGFTGHEHLDSLGLIHMNGRVYDYRLGRFLSVDPLIQFPANSQSLNPYSYVMNNPMAGTDPSGYAIRDKRRYLNGNGPCMGDLDCEYQKAFDGPVASLRNSLGAGSRFGSTWNGRDERSAIREGVTNIVEIGSVGADITEGQALSLIDSAYHLALGVPMMSVVAGESKMLLTGTNRAAQEIPLAERMRGEFKKDGTSGVDINLLARWDSNYPMAENFPRISGVRTIVGHEFEGTTNLADERKGFEVPLPYGPRKAAAELRALGLRESDAVLVIVCNGGRSGFAQKLYEVLGRTNPVTAATGYVAFGMADVPRGHGREPGTYFYFPQFLDDKKSMGPNSRATWITYGGE